MADKNHHKIKFAFFGTPEVASETLEALKNAGYLPSLVITAPDRPQGRKMIITPPPVKVWALSHNIPCLQPEKLDISIFQDNFDLFIVVAYGKIIAENILKIPRLGSVNVHYSLLPKYRGASPVEAAILNGETKTGVSIQKMVYKMDAGPVIASQETDIGDTETAPELRKRLIKIGGDLLISILPNIISGNIAGKEQNENLATYCKKIKKEDGLIDLSAEPKANYNKFRAYFHWPRSFFFQGGKRIIVTDAELKDGKFVVKKVLPEGKKEIGWDRFISK